MQHPNSFANLRKGWARSHAQKGPRWKTELTEGQSGLSTEQEKRFWEKVNKSGPVIQPELGPCWIWTHSRTRHGYGDLTINRQTLRAHRVAFVLRFGAIKTGVFICHSCDNPPCVNPDHLFIGDAAANTRDMEHKGRHAYGERHPCSKIKIEDALKIISIHKTTGKNARMISNELCLPIKESCIRDIIKGRKWRYACEQYNQNALADAQERRRRERAQDLEDYRDILGGDHE